MPLFRRRGSAPETHPSFEDVADRALRALGREFDLRGDRVDIKLTHGWRDYDLRPVRARCDARPPDTWLGLVTRDLRETVELAEREPPLPAWDAAKALLKLRMYPRTALPAGYPLGVPFSDDLMAALSLDRGESARLVGVSDANGWGRPFEELVRIAHVNTREEPGLEHERIVLKGGGGEAVLCSSKRWYAATHALWADELLGEPGRHGALVAAPNPHVAMAYAIDDHRARSAIEILEPWTQRRVEAVKNPISPHLYWWRPGRVVRLDAERRAELDALLGPAPATRVSSSSTSTTSTRRR